MAALNEAKAQAAQGSAFDRVPPSRSSPIDLVHLARQTGGDRRLERSVIVMLARQIDAAEAAIATLGCEERRMLAHRLKGASLSVGAFALARAAGELEEAPQDETRFGAFRAALIDARQFAAALD